jgi:hypothetical protein
VKEKFWDNCGEATGKQDRLAFESHNRSSRPRREAHATFERILVRCRVVDAGTGFADAARPLSANKSGSLHDHENPTRIAQDCRYQVAAVFAGFRRVNLTFRSFYRRSDPNNNRWSRSLLPGREVAASGHFEAGQKLDIALLASSGALAKAGFLI